MRVSEKTPAHPDSPQSFQGGQDVDSTEVFNGERNCKIHLTEGGGREGEN